MMMESNNYAALPQQQDRNSKKQKKNDETANDNIEFFSSLEARIVKLEEENEELRISAEKDRRHRSDDNFEADLGDKNEVFDGDDEEYREDRDE